jgi:hypothetical protein
MQQNLKERELDTKKLQADSKLQLDDLRTQISRISYSISNSPEKIHDADEAVLLLKEGIQSLIEAKKPQPKTLKDSFLQSMYLMSVLNQVKKLLNSKPTRQSSY